LDQPSGWAWDPQTSQIRRFGGRFTEPAHAVCGIWLDQPSEWAWEPEMAHIRPFDG
jgi:hypothetical protein